MPDIFATNEQSVPVSAELVRVSRLPRRSWTVEATEEVVRELTRELKTPGGTMTLRPIQAVALYEIGEFGGLFGIMSCGAGKTLVSLLASIVCDARRPLLLVPAALVGKTSRDKEKLAKHWRLPEIRVESYELLGRMQAAELLEQYDPDLVVCDEAHKLKHVSDAAVAKRVRRWFRTHPGVGCVAMSGTMTKRSLHDYAHILRWCLPPERVPLPRAYSDLERWADALDERKVQERRADPGALKVFCNEEELRIWDSDRRVAARHAFRRRLIETGGVVATYEAAVDSTLTVSAVEPLVSVSVDGAFAKLRRDWELPDGQPLKDGLEIFRHARELGLGFFYSWDPPAPQHWLEARRVWSAFVRRVLGHSRKLDSEAQVAHEYADAPELLEWRRVERDFEPNTVPTWLDDGVLRFAAEWAGEKRGIVWVEHTCVGERLEDDFGLAYYGEEGCTRAGAYIEEHPVGTPLAASIHSNREGRNLQAWSTNLVVSPPPDGERFEQLIARTHREGQEAEEVSVDVVATCVEHLKAVWQAVSDCEYVLACTGSPQKLLLAGLDVPRVEDTVFRSGPRWNP